MQHSMYNRGCAHANRRCVLCIGGISCPAHTWSRPPLLQRRSPAIRADGCVRGSFWRAWGLVICELPSAGGLLMKAEAQGGRGTRWPCLSVAASRPYAAQEKSTTKVALGLSSCKPANPNPSLVLIRF